MIAEPDITGIADGNKVRGIVIHLFVVNMMNLKCSPVLLSRLAATAAAIAIKSRC